MPMSVNSMYRGRRFLTREAKTNKEAMEIEAMSVWGRKDPLKGKVSLTARFYWKDERRHDFDNLKSFYDSLSGICYEDDSQIKEAHIFVFKDKENPRVEFEISAL